MRSCGLTLQRQVLDNEASVAYKQSILESGLTYQLVPPNDHRRNVAKKAIQTWKDHIIAVLSGTADKFPLHLWCQLISHMEQQLNLLWHGSGCLIRKLMHRTGSKHHQCEPSRNHPRSKPAERPELHGSLQPDRPGSVVSTNEQ